MPRQVAILHGWSDTSQSFEPLLEFLRDNGFETVPLWLGDYISLDDDVKIEDVAKRMDQVIREKMDKKELVEPFDLIVHSTGGLVARLWLCSYSAPGACPMKRLLMLAPANFGSRLATMGQSALGRLVKGWRNWFHTGEEMLRSLELASRFQWQLAHRDLFVPEREANASAYYGPSAVWPFVIIGTHPYADLLRRVLNEDGSDGTVRAAAANLNVRGITIDFARDEDNPVWSPWELRHGRFEFPFAVLPDRTHASIINPEENDTHSSQGERKTLGQLILDALCCETIEQYGGIAAEWGKISEATAQLAASPARLQEVFPAAREGHAVRPQYFHQYLQVVVRVVDDHGDEVPDYFLEFFGPDSKKDDEAVYFHSEVLENVHPRGEQRATRCLYVDRTDLVNEFYKRIPSNSKKRELALSISAQAPGDNVSYFRNGRFGASGHVVVHREAEEQRWFRRNSTHFVKIIIPRSPKESVFKLTRR